MAQESRHRMQESDIGSREKTPAQQDIESEIASLQPPAGVDQDRQGQHGKSDDTMTTATKSRQALNGTHLHQGVEEQHRIPKKQDPADVQDTSALPSRILRNGAQLARIAALPLPDGTYEAQVFVRLAREPELAETSIPAGTFLHEDQAWAAAEGRARRAFAEHEIQ